MAPDRSTTEGAAAAPAVYTLEGLMENKQALITRMYAAFNRRDIDGVLAQMAEDVDWPKASEGGRVIGKDEIRAYWTRQWAEFDPHVEPVEVIDFETGKTHVKVHQIVKNLHGDVLADQEVWHIYTIVNGLIERMDIPETSAAFPVAAHAERS